MAKIAKRNKSGKKSQNGRHPDSPLSVVGTRRWQATVPAHLQDSLAKALSALEDNRLGQALIHFGECAELEEREGRLPHKAVLYFGGQAAVQAYFFKKGENPNDPRLKEWRSVAEALVTAAYEIDKADAVACHNVGRFYQDEGEDELAIQYYKHTLMLDSSQVETYGNLGTAYYQRGEVEQAWAMWRKCVSLTPDKASGKIAQSYIWLRLGEYEQGWQAFNARWDDLSFQHGYGRQKELGGIHWRGGPLPKNARLLLHGEQGLGDHVQFARYIPVLRGLGYELVGVETRGILARWMAASFPDLNIIVRDQDKFPDFTHHCSTMDLPYLLGTTVETIPPPVEPTITFEQRRDAMQRLLEQSDYHTIAHSFRVGIAWEGAKGNTADAIRSIPAEELRHVADIPGVTWVSLQFAPDAPIVGHSWLGKNFVDGTEGCKDVLDTAAVMRGLDIIVTVDTLSAHLAGTLGVPTWVLHRYCREWRWGDETVTGEGCPWYPSITSLTQRAPGDWRELLCRVRRMLTEKGCQA